MNANTYLLAAIGISVWADGGDLDGYAAIAVYSLVSVWAVGLTNTYAPAVIAFFRKTMGRNGC